MAAFADSIYLGLILQYVSGSTADGSLVQYYFDDHAVEAVIATGKKNLAKWTNPLTVLFPLNHRGLFSLPRFKCEMEGHPVF